VTQEKATTDQPDSEPASPTAGTEPTYPDAPDALIAQWMRRRRRMSFGPGEGLPPLDVDLKPLLAARIPFDEARAEGKQSLHGMKLREMRAELAGKPELAALNAILIAHLRKSRFPKHASTLFNRIWEEEGQALMPELPGRWLISSIITFGDHGESEAQRRIGLTMNVLFSLMKLYEFERFHSGFAPEKPFPIRRIKGRKLPVGMPYFALLDGGLDINLLAQLWDEARAEPVAGRLACYLLERLNHDPSNLFRRIGLMRAAKRNRAPKAVPPEVPAG
jgi:hypothetical protein